jgi:hypothetical protein
MHYRLNRSGSGSEVGRSASCQLASVRLCRRPVRRAYGFPARVFPFSLWAASLSLVAWFKRSFSGQAKPDRTGRRQSRTTDDSIITRRRRALNGGDIRIGNLFHCCFRVQPILKCRVNERSEQRMRGKWF